MPSGRFGSDERPRGGGGAPGQQRGGGGGGGGKAFLAGNPDDLRIGAPSYIAKLSGEPKFCPPGHSFRLYFRGWDEHWNLTKQKREVLDQVVKLPHVVFAQTKALIDRQRAAARGDQFMSFSCETTSPFTTGLGNEHPLENGFAFLDPYGVPYLPGSGVKGTIRRAAEELALFEEDNQGWTIPAVWWLFGFDAQAAYFRSAGPKDDPVIREQIERWRQAYGEKVSQRVEGDLLFGDFCELVKTPKITAEQIKEALASLGTGENRRRIISHVHAEGALRFFDVIPLCHGGLKVDIMNPHCGHYYQHGEPPGDWGTPMPIFFLTLPPKTEFNFIVRFAPPISWPKKVRSFFEDASDGEPRWKRLVKAAFEFAWEWQGFGAKTAVGYGRFTRGR